MPGAQAAFQVFGMELLAKLDLRATNQFFATFFRLPGTYWRGFLASRLSSAQLLAFAALTWLLAPPAIKVRLPSALSQQWQESCEQCHSCNVVLLAAARACCSHCQFFNPVGLWAFAGCAGDPPGFKSRRRLPHSQVPWWA